MSSRWPENVGIRAIEVLFPAQYVDQAELEQFDGASAGKYTIGLGQAKMGFCSDREDVNSLCLTVVSRLLERHHIKHTEIGRLEVGTETIVDKSKSVKSVLMQLFAESGNTDIEGIDTTNACYGGTAALFNALNWIESSSWDGRYALAVCADIAVYAKGAARPTGGAGAIAMLVGPQAALIFERGLRATHMEHAYDFYKPDLSSEYPTVDGKLSIQCYLSALDICYRLYRKKFEKQHPEQSQRGLQNFDAILFHTPFCKLVQKSVGRLSFNDFLLSSEQQRLEHFAGLERFNSATLESTYFDRDVEKAFLAQSAEVFASKTKKSLLLANQVGNMYTPSVYSGLVSLLIGGPAADLVGKRIGVFSYGSGLAASMYSIKVTQDVTAFEKFVAKLDYVLPLLNAREKIAPEQFSALMEVRERNNHAAPYTPTGSISALSPGTYYLKDVDALHRRSYDRTPTITNGVH
ncbi:hydroxymethylglutaryl-CoA synthase 1 [Drosophila grimshawi]|uniref:Hydroxymethylglutaryl-CoA synthase n=1 Tax=Drosophila grimshawi TaxID=7222 RepID=B4J8F1_DROGR|nr:hydroxymethylglutaryl-CoA synthase 1 [Drosophila grimshawi]XP_032589988.1 hydroxymethylglutaryl-CoA synthase 1 [Drosophila grimshawi]EDW02310.1 GH19963 [Drosophila grimshawi]